MLKREDSLSCLEKAKKMREDLLGKAFECDLEMMNYEFHVKSTF
jgi:hypothetical protein